EMMHNLSVAVLKLRDPLVDLHADLWEDRQKFEQALGDVALPAPPAAGGTAASKTASVDRANQALKVDNYSLKAFQEVYLRLKDAGDTDRLELFIDGNLDKYLGARQFREQLAEFFLAQEDF